MEGESSSGYLCRLEKKHCSQCVISAVPQSDGVVRVDIEVIQAVLASFYVSLFAKEVTNQVAQTYLLSCVTDRVPADRVDDCKGLLSDEECLMLCLA